MRYLAIGILLISVWVGVALVISAQIKATECKNSIYVETDIVKDDIQPKIQQWDDQRAQWQVLMEYNKYTLIVKVPCKGLSR